MESYRIENLSFTYPQGRVKALDNISISIMQGEFLTLCGSSACGKTTFLRQLKPILRPHGKKEGKIFYQGQSLISLDQRRQSSEIGFVMQSPDKQIVTDKVWHELAFGLESLGFDSPTIRLRVAEMASFFGIETYFHKDVSELSGGQKQLLNLASIMVMHPSVLILDEPTSQLDPIAAREFLSVIEKINRELGVTIIITEHRLEEVFPLSDRVLVMEKGRIICDGNPRQVGKKLIDMQDDMFYALPAPMRIYAGVKNDLPCPITVREGRSWLDRFTQDRALINLSNSDKHLSPTRQGEPIIEFDGVYFRYKKEAEDVVKNLSMAIYPGEFYSILGGNGAGKTTVLSLIAGINRPHRGSIKILGKDISKSRGGELASNRLGVLPQDPQSLFVKNTLAEDLLEIFSGTGKTGEEREERIREVVRICQLEGLLGMHPYDLSGGEQQRAALAKVLLLEARILLLDEPTKGMDASFKEKFATILYQLVEKGVTIVMVSHDIEFCASHAQKCAMFFDGNMVSWGTAKEFFSRNSFYTTAANRMVRHKLPEAVTVEDVVEACGGDIRPIKIGPRNKTDLTGPLYKEREKTMGENKKKKDLPLWRKIGGVLAFLALVFTLFLARENIMDISRHIARGDLSILQNRLVFNHWRYTIIILALAIELVVFALMLYPQKKPIIIKEIPAENRQLSKRTLLAMIMVFIAIPLTIYIGIYHMGDRKYYFISMLIILETMLPFIMVFEDRKPQVRELIIIAVLCAIAVAGRTAFFMLPQFKPVVAIVIIAGVAFGGESGFLVGVVTGFVSNMFIGQGPWTPWQMFALGLIGFIAGLLFRKGFIVRNTAGLCIFGGLATFFIYGGIMNPASVLIFQANPSRSMFYFAYVKGIPFDIVHATATVVFLYFAAIPMLEKLERIKVKFGLIEGPDKDKKLDVGESYS